MRRPVVPFASVALALALAAPAVADKAPTASQREGIAHADHAPARCLIIRVSSVRSTWGSLRFDDDKYSSCKRYAADGIAIVHRSGRTWKQTYAGSDCRRPPAKEVPAKVWKDLSRTFCGN